MSLHSSYKHIDVRIYIERDRETRGEKQKIGKRVEKKSANKLNNARGNVQESVTSRLLLYIMYASSSNIMTKNYIL